MTPGDLSYKTRSVLAHNSLSFAIDEQKSVWHSFKHSFDDPTPNLTIFSTNQDNYETQWPWNTNIDYKHDYYFANRFDHYCARLWIFLFCVSQGQVLHRTLNLANEWSLKLVSMPWDSAIRIEFRHFGRKSISQALRPRLSFGLL